MSGHKNNGESSAANDASGESQAQFSGEPLVGEEQPPKAIGELQKETLQKLTDLLHDGSSEGQPSLKENGGSHTSQETLELANHLFAKAPEDFLSLRSSEELMRITDTLHRELNKFLGGEARYSVLLEAEGEKVRIFAVLGDRPFIINSIRECILQYGSSIEVFLHPILLREGQRLSCSYIEIRGMSEERGGLLKKDLERCVEHVLVATDDFTSMLVRVETLARVIDSKRPLSFFPQQEQTETTHLLRWLTDGGFLFTGLTVWEPAELSELPKTTQEQLGIHRLESSYGADLRQELLEDVQSSEEQEEIIAVSRVRSESLVQRRSQMLNITLYEPSSDGKQLTCYQVTGLLTSKALSEESSSVPFLRRKLKRILELEGAVDQSHDHKNIVNIFNSMPKEECFRLDFESLRSVIHTILDIQNRNETRVSVRFDRKKRSASVLIVMPRDRFNTSVRHRIQDYVEKVFHTVPGSSEYFLDLSNKPHARFYFHIPVPRSGLPDLNIAELKANIAELTRGWRENLEERIFGSQRFEDPNTIWSTYSNAFGNSYQALQSIDDCEHDIARIERLTSDQPIIVSMRPSEEEVPGSFVLILYKRGEDLTISYAFPILENAGLEVLNERAFHVKPLRKDKVSIQRFLVRTKSGAFLSREAFNQFLAPGLEQVLNTRAKNDALNSLMISANLGIDAIALLRAYCSLLWQVNKFASKSIIHKALTSVPSAASQLWNMFEIRFNPDLDSTLESREQRFETTLSTFRDSLRDVSDITSDRILRSISQLLEHTVRTNFYREGSTIALKLHSEKIDIIPHPRPKFEIFVRGRGIEGVHLRAGSIARGGLRWSDRHQDFRQEILDLVKTQNVKNALIVPVGAKGGFVVKDLPELASDQRIAVERAYKEFIRSLLSITDNRSKGEIVRPDRIVAYDGDDPYLVVAADKGTATFSDLANSIAVDEFNFWLGDAFASGGSEGYDHKVYGITARGAWESVKRHFTNLGIDYQNEPFTVVGIGDMSGDVFGNGLIESDKAKLLAAFNHRHIFLDPNPDPATSFQERKRMFELPRSAWTDYSEECISEGGGVFDRSAREIPLTPQVREMLALPEDSPHVVDGETLISLILQAPADLLWNGGIGTYVKGKYESHADVNDGTNDRVRVDAGSLRVKVIGEGGNLGLTQKARIEFAKRGGQVNTDAIDNSGGVDLSDHEVNLKILFEGLMKNKKLTLSDRNQLLRDIAPDVVSEVLRHNFNHALALTIGVRRSRRGIDYFKSLLREMTKRGIVNRQIENLPDDEELLERARRKEGLQKPELAVCLAAVKRWVKGELEQSRLTDDPLLDTFLLEYFPESVRKKYRDEIIAHPLANNIVATQVSNELIDSLGITFVHRMCVTHSTSALNVMKSTLAADMLMRSRKMREELRQLYGHQQGRRLLELLEELNSSLRDLAAWCIGYHSQSTLRDIVGFYQSGFQSLINLEGETLSENQKELYELRFEKYTNYGLSESSAKTFASFPQTLLFMEILWASRKVDCEAPQVAKMYYAIMDALLIDDILSVGFTIEVKSKWEAELQLGALRDVRRSVSLLTCQMLTREDASPSTVADMLRDSEAAASLRSLILELKTGDPSVVEIAVLSRHLLELPRLLS